ncbi:dynamin family protein [Leifsonia sp. Leaf264]|uniref:dynamin family protein n=1 Tax=Leifsonia sp. Leaf264 TaxID=1736314 RepID=UPI0006FBB079|nr:dynamin family protein [Leifsonia sp. Leaf264]KQO98485.1 hypothetical protein ASF30_10510 [Leifsonia sp. Leaf264]
MTDSTPTGTIRPPARGAAVTATTHLLTEAEKSLTSHGYGPKVADIRWRRTQLLETPATIVVVGELSAGKSSIVNALIGEPEFAPVGDKVTTAVTLRFTPPTEALPAGTIRLNLDGEYRVIGRDHFNDWVTADGTFTNSPAADPLTGVDIGHESPELPGVTIIDTPGAGGLSEDHARRALAAAERAGVLLIVAEAEGRLTRSTLSFLRLAAQFSGTIIVAVNKIDLKHNWKVILEEDAAVLKETKFPPADLVGVSALWAENALTEDADRDRWRELSRIDDLVDALARPLSQANRIPDINALAQLRDVLITAVTNLDEQLLLLAEPDRTKELWEQRKADLAKIRKDMRNWRYRLSRGMNELRTEILNQQRRLLAEFEEQWHTNVKSLSGQSKTKAQMLQRDMAAAVVEIEQTVAKVMEAQAAAIVKRLFTSAGLPVPDSLVGDITFDAVEKPNLRATFESGGKVGVMASGVTMAMMLARPGMLLGPLVGGFAAPIIAVGVLGGFMLTARIRNSRELQQRITDHTRVLQQELADALQQCSSFFSADVAEAFEDAVRDAEEDLDMKIREAERAKSESAMDRARRLSDYKAAKKTFEELNVKAGKEYRRLRGNLTTPGRV